MYTRLQIPLWSTLAVLGLCLNEGTADHTTHKTHGARPPKANGIKGTSPGAVTTLKGSGAPSTTNANGSIVGTPMTPAPSTGTKSVSGPGSNGTVPVVSISSKASTAAAIQTSTASMPVVTTSPYNTGMHHHHLAMENVLRELHGAIYLLHDGAHVAQHQRARAEAEIKKAIHLLKEDHQAHQNGTKRYSKPTSAHHATTSPQNGAIEQKLLTADSKLHQSAHLVHGAIHRLQHLQGEHHHVHLFCLSRIWKNTPFGLA
jgi:hypothetical protein